MPKATHTWTRPYFMSPEKESNPSLSHYTAVGYHAFLETWWYESKPFVTVKISALDGDNRWQGFGNCDEKVFRGYPSMEAAVADAKQWAETWSPHVIGRQEATEPKPMFPYLRRINV